MKTSVGAVLRVKNENFVSAAQLLCKSILFRKSGRQGPLGLDVSLSAWVVLCGKQMSNSG